MTTGLSLTHSFIHSFNKHPWFQVAEVGKQKGLEMRVVAREEGDSWGGRSPGTLAVGQGWQEGTLHAEKPSALPFPLPESI